MNAVERDDPLAGLGREQFEERLRQVLRGRVAEAWVFGSYAEGALRPGSDIDLFLVQPTALPFGQRPFAFADLLDLGPATVGFWRSAVAQMRRLL